MGQDTFTLRKGHIVVGVFWLWIVVGIVLGFNTPQGIGFGMWLMGTLGVLVATVISVVMYKIVEDGL